MKIKKPPGYFKKKCSSRGAFTLTELLISAVVLVFTFMGILIAYLKCLELNEISRNSSLAVQAAKSKTEAVKNTPFDQVIATHNNTTFAVSGVNGMGSVRVVNVDSDILQITVTVCWRQSNGRIYGEDSNLNGQLNAGEDQNGNGALDSPVQMVNYVFGG